MFSKEKNVYIEKQKEIIETFFKTFIDIIFEIFFETFVEIFLTFNVFSKRLFLLHYFSKCLLKHFSKLFTTFFICLLKKEIFIIIFEK